MILEIFGAWSNIRPMSWFPGFEGPLRCLRTEDGWSGLFIRGLYVIDPHIYGWVPLHPPQHRLGWWGAPPPWPLPLTHPLTLIFSSLLNTILCYLHSLITTDCVWFADRHWYVPDLRNDHASNGAVAFWSILRHTDVLEDQERISRICSRTSRFCGPWHFYSIYNVKLRALRVSTVILKYNYNILIVVCNPAK